MSDGPHRTLKMRPAWKKFAEIADNRAYTPEQVAWAAAPALSQDWRGDVSEALAACVCEIFADQQESLFNDQKVSQLSALKALTAGHELGELFVDCAIQSAISGPSSPEAAVQAAAKALSIWSARHARQVEEHYRRESSIRRASNVRSRIESALEATSHGRLARQLLNMDVTPVSRNVPKFTGLDEGVPLW